MPLAFAPASQATSVWFKLLLYGNSGAGKTWRSCQVRKPGDTRKVLGLLTEANGVQSARHANPDILLPSWPLTKREKKGEETVEVPVLGKDGKPMVRHYALTVEEVREVLRAVINREIPDLDTLVVDGLTEVQAMMKDEMIAFKEQAVREGKAKKGTEIFSQADWGELNEKMRRFMRSLRDLPINVVSTALADVETEENGEVKIRYTIPSFQGRKLHNQAAAFQNVVAYCYTSSGRTEKGARKIDRLAMVEGPETIQCKPAHPLTGVLEQPLWEWMDLLAAGPDAPKVGREMTEEEKKALEQAQEEGAVQTQERRAKEETGTAGTTTTSTSTPTDGTTTETTEKEKETPATEKPKGGRVRRSS